MIGLDHISEQLNEYKEEAISFCNSSMLNLNETDNPNLLFYAYYYIFSRKKETFVEFSDLFFSLHNVNLYKSTSLYSDYLKFLRKNHIKYEIIPMEYYFFYYCRKFHQEYLPNIDIRIIIELFEVIKEQFAQRYITLNHKESSILILFLIIYRLNPIRATNFKKYMIKRKDKFKKILRDPFLLKLAEQSIKFI